MYKRGAEYKNYISHCNLYSNEFCGIKTFDYKIPNKIRNSLIHIANLNVAKRVNIYNWKAGKTISTKQLLEFDSDIIEWYKLFAKYISNIINENVTITPLYMPTSCALLIYDEENDFINWHFDQNHFQGRFFTVLLPITLHSTCTKYMYKDKDANIQQIDQHEGNIIFEGSKVFHMASKLCKGEKRIILSLQYVTNDNIDLLNTFLLKIKDFAYIGSL